MHHIQVAHLTNSDAVIVLIHHRLEGGGGGVSLSTFSAEACDSPNRIAECGSCGGWLYPFTTRGDDVVNDGNH